MASSWASVCSSALVLVLLGSSSGVRQIPDSLSQREVDFSELLVTQIPDSMSQREVDISELLGTVNLHQGEHILQQEFRPEWLPDFPTREWVPFGPRGFAPMPERYPVKFPLGRPTSDNLQAICVYGNRRPRYPKSYFPSSGFGSQLRRGIAVNSAESWFSTCCKGNQTWGTEKTLCCTTQAWELSIESFCEEEFGIKTSHYHCCKRRGSVRLNCFHDNAPNPNYEPTEEVPKTHPSSTGNAPNPNYEPTEELPKTHSYVTSNFMFDPSTCQREMEPPSSDVTFPPGRPTEDTIKSLCHSEFLKFLYDVKWPKGADYKLIAHQARTINRMKRGFKLCCKKKKNILTCAEQKWSGELNRFCLDKKGGKVNFSCCLGDETNKRYSCFQQVAPDPYYNMSSTASH